MKSASVSYTANKRCKTLSIPFIGEDFTFGTGMSDPIWRQGVYASDFVLFPSGGIPQAKSRMVFFRNTRHLLIGFFFEEPDLLRTHLTAESTSMWQADLAELHFGGLEPDPWLLQLAIGIDGIRFDSTGSLNRWDAAVFSCNEGWGAEVRLELGLLCQTEGGVRFNLVRESLKRRERIVWSPLKVQYHEVPNFGELLFAGYNEVASIRTGRHFQQQMSRNDFEIARNSWETPANNIVHGPYLSCPDKDTVCINWQTAGKVAAYLDYRKKGSGAAFKRCTGDFSCGILPCETMHFIKLFGLCPDTEYEYRLISLFPVTGEEIVSETTHIFRTMPLPGQNTPFSFFLLTDLHSDADYLRNALLLPEAQQAGFMVLLGDNLSYASGPEGIFAGVIDPIVQFNQQNGRDIPLVFVRGNHEELGIYASEYLRIMRHPSNRSWYTFSLGKTFFIVLDSGDDTADSPERPFFRNTAMFEQEQRFLEETVKSDEYRNADFRIVLMHIPPISGGKTNISWPLQRQLTSPLEQAEIHPDLMVCGHEHRNIWIDAGDPAGLSFPILVSAHRNALTCEISHNTIRLQLLSPLKNGRKEIVQTITISPHLPPKNLIF